MQIKRSRQDSNLRPLAPEANALSTELRELLDNCIKEYAIIQTMRSAKSFVEVSHVFAEYGGKASILKKVTGQSAPEHSILRDVSFSLKMGDRITLFGREGSGKSTLLRLLSGAVTPSRGKIIINGKNPSDVKNLAAGYVSPEESEVSRDSVHTILHSFGKTHGLEYLPARIGELATALNFSDILNRPAGTLSTSQRLRVNLARAALADSPFLILDDTADVLGVPETLRLLSSLFAGRCAIISTRNVATAEQLDLALLLLHGTAVTHRGTRDQIATALSCPRVLDVWVEGLRYDLLRKLKTHAGIVSVRLISTTQYSGQKLRITIHSSRYLPSVYDLISQAPLVRVQEIPPSLEGIMQKLT